MSIFDRFKRFVHDISPTTLEVFEANQRYEAVAKKLHAEYYGTPFTGTTAMVIGSYGKGTQVSPPRDVDMLFLMPEGQFATYDRSFGNGQSQLLQAVKRRVASRYPSTDVRGDGQVVVVPFGVGHKVEVLPAWHNRGGGFIVPNSHNGGHWNVVNHYSEIRNVENSDVLSKGNTRHLIRMLKTWQSVKNVRIKSLVLELHSVDFIGRWQHQGNSYTFYDWMIRDFFEDLLRYANGKILIPGTTNEYKFYSDEWVPAARIAYNAASRACVHEAAYRETSAVVEWQNIFGRRYRG